MLSLEIFHVKQNTKWIKWNLLQINQYATVRYFSKLCFYLDTPQEIVWRAKCKKQKVTTAKLLLKIFKITGKKYWRNSLRPCSHDIVCQIHVFFQECNCFLILAKVLYYKKREKIFLLYQAWIFPRYSIFGLTFLVFSTAHLP